MPVVIWGLQNSTQWEVYFIFVPHSIYSMELTRVNTPQCMYSMEHTTSKILLVRINNMYSVNQLPKSEYGHGT